MPESLGPRPAATGGLAAALQNGQGDKVVHRPKTTVLPAEPVEKSAPTGPRPYFEHTYLERVASYWPIEPEPPKTSVDYEIPAPEVPEPAGPTVDIRG